ncbi:methionine--tRNA ligase [candidate division WOR-3 bacterium]|nr:methionine--tRNA ligase [candidate division WOR-3 bacterium]
MKILVTSALPYANGEIHFGHLAGAYLPADIYVKYHRLKGSDIVFICGSDEHGVPITIAAQQAGISPRELVDRYHPSIKKSFQEFGIEFDNYSRTSLPIHYETAQDFFLKVYRNGFIAPKTTKQLYCPRCRMFLADRYVEGVCPACGTAGARGDQCEACGKWLEPFELVEPKCKTCGATPEVKETTHWFFALSKIEDRLKAWLETKQHWKPNVKRFCEGWFKRGLQDRPITRDLSWGVPVPLPEAKNKVMYVWFDAPIGYISSTKEWAKNTGKPDKWQEYWLDPKTKLVHFIGKDNIVFHAIVWPAMLMAHGDYVLPAEIPANEFLNLEGAKLSTSRNWAIWLPDYLKRYQADPLRYSLAVNLPENRDVDFTWADFLARNNNELADVFGNFVNRVAVFIKKNYGGRVPSAPVIDEPAEEVLTALSKATQEIGQLIESFQIKDATRLLMTLPALGNRYFDHETPWRTFKENRARCDRTINVCTRLVSALEILTFPFMPETSRKIGRMLSLGKRSWNDAANPALPGELTGPVEILFEKLDEAIVIRERARLGAGSVNEAKEEKDMITIDDFKRVELRVARIVSAERVVGTTKLIKMMIDLGNEQRQIVAGIGEAYQPEELIGRNVVVVANLQPARIRGVESNGMLLAAVDGSKVALVTIDQEVTPGALVS